MTALELLEGDYRSLLMPYVDMKHWWGIMYEHVYGSFADGRKRRLKFPPLPKTLFDRVEAVWNATPPITLNRAHAISPSLKPLMHARLNDKIVTVQKTHSRFGKPGQFAPPTYTAVRVTITDDDSEIVTAYVGLPPTSDEIARETSRLIETHKHNPLWRWHNVSRNKWDGTSTFPRKSTHG